MGTRRRDFLRPSRLISLAGATMPQVPSQEKFPGERIIRASRRAMACRFEILLPSRDRSRIMIVHQALDLVQQLEKQMTVFRDDSEIAHLNRNAFEQPVCTEEGLFKLLQLGKRIYRDTGGAFDMTASPLWKCWGFSDRKGELPDPGTISKALSKVGSCFLELDQETRIVGFQRRGLELNLGAIGKGHALDRVGDLFKFSGLNRILVHAGCSSILALGEGPERESSGWKISLRHPLGKSKPLATICLRNQALSTSGVGEQFFHSAGRRFGHVIDPRTGYPADRNLSATVLARTAAEADALSTAFLIMDAKDVLSYCRKHRSIGAVVVEAGRHEGLDQVHYYGLALDDLEVSC